MWRERVLLYVRGSATRRGHQRNREKGGTMPTRLLPPTGRILVGIDGSPASVAAVRWAGREAQLRGMRVHVVYVRDRRLPTPHYAPQPRAGEPVPSPAAGERMQAVVREALGTQPPAGVQMELADGLPARVLIDRSVGAEELVLGRARPGGAGLPARRTLPGGGGPLRRRGRPGRGPGPGGLHPAGTAGSGARLSVRSGGGPSSAARPSASRCPRPSSGAVPAAGGRLPPR